MKWFKHDSDANMDAKLQQVLLDYGLEGYGLYWYCIELITGKVGDDNLTFELEHDSRVIARNTGSTQQKVEEMMRYFVKINLFDENNGNIRCLKLLKRLDQSMTSNNEFRQLIAVAKKSHDPVMISHDSVMNKTIQDKTSLEENKTSCAKQSFTPDEKVTKFDKTPYEEILNLYHEILPELNSVKKLTPARRTQIKTRWRNELDSLDEWRDYFELVRESGFLMGKTDPGRYRSKSWQADIDWLIKQGNVVKVCEGKYHGHG